MPITTYSELQQAVADWMNRADLSATIPNFIANAEARLNRRIRCRAMETSTSLSLNTEGQATLPNDYLEWRFLTVATSPASVPEFVEPDSPEFQYRHRPYAPPQYFSIMGTTIQVRPAYNGSATLYYYQKIPALSGSVTTNWLLTKSPETYLYAALIEGAIYLRDEAAAANYTELMVSAVDELLQEDRAGRNRRNPTPPLVPSSKTMDIMTGGAK